MTKEVNQTGAAAPDDTNAATPAGPAQATPDANTPAKEPTSAKAESSSLLGDDEPASKEPAGTPEKADATKADPKDAGKSDAPEKYEFTLPEGRVLEESVIGKFSETAKELGLSNEKAQKLVTLADEHAQLIEKKLSDSWAEQRKEWVDTLKADKDFGGDNLKETLDRAKRVLNENDGAELRSFLISSGLGDNHLLIKFLAKLDKKTGEDNLVGGKVSASPETKTAAQLIYGH